MISTNHNTNITLTGAEKQELRKRLQAKSDFVSEALAALNRLMNTNVTSQSVREAVATLRQEPRTTVPPQYLESGAVTSRSTTARTPSARHRSLVRDSTHNKEFERRLALREGSDDFHIPLSRPLPLSYEGQCDHRFLTGAHRRHSFNVVSDFAPLFSRGSRPMSAEERERLSFLAPAKDSPKEQVLKVMQERHQYDRVCEPNAKILFNEPKRLPNLSRKVSPDFVPGCAAKLTESTNPHFVGNVARVSQNNTTGNRVAWR